MVPALFGPLLKQRSPQKYHQISHVFQHLLVFVFAGVHCVVIKPRAFRTQLYNLSANEITFIYFKVKDVVLIYEGLSQESILLF